MTDFDFFVYLCLGLKNIFPRGHRLIYKEVALVENLK